MNDYKTQPYTDRWSRSSIAVNVIAMVFGACLMGAVFLLGHGLHLANIKINYLTAASAGQHESLVTQTLGRPYAVATSTAELRRQVTGSGYSPMPPNPITGKALVYRSRGWSYGIVVFVDRAGVVEALCFIYT